MFLQFQFKNYHLSYLKNIFLSFRATFITFTPYFSSFLSLSSIFVTYDFFQFHSVVILHLDLVLHFYRLLQNFIQPFDLRIKILASENILLEIYESSNVFHFLDRFLIVENFILRNFLIGFKPPHNLLLVEPLINIAIWLKLKLKTPLTLLPPIDIDIKIERYPFLPHLYPQFLLLVFVGGTRHQFLLSSFSYVMELFFPCVLVECGRVLLLGGVWDLWQLLAWGRARGRHRQLNCGGRVGLGDWGQGG